MSARIKILGAIYIFILAGIVFLADLYGMNFFSFIRYIPFGDKVGHFCLMGMFSLVVNLAFKARTIQLWKLSYLLGSLLVLVIVTLEEFSQIFVHGRSFDAGDLVADAAGIIIFGEIARLICRRTFKN